MTPLLDTHLSALRILAHRLHALDCTVASFSGGTEFDAPIVRIGVPSAALLDWLDAHRIPIHPIASMRAAHVDGCTVAWPAAANVRVDEGEHVEIGSF